jgi:two-component system, OmpR family, sensor kinase
MRLSTRLTILLITITSLVAGLVGWYAVATSTRSDYAALDTTINAVIASGTGHPLTALSSALGVVQENNYDLTLDLVGADGRVTQIVGGIHPLRRPPTRADVQRSLTGVRASSDLPGFRYRSIDVGGGDFLVVAASTDQVVHRSHRLIVGTVLAGLAAAAVMDLVARLFIRRDLRAVKNLVNYSTAVAHGDVEEPLPPPRGSADIRSLQSSLGQMVASLKATIAAEQHLAQVTQRFIGDASHELRTPLTVVKGYAELLTRADVDDEQRDRALNRIRREVARMDSLVSDLLFLAEVKEVPVLDREPVDASELLAGRVREFAVDHPDHPLTVDVAPGAVVLGRRDFFERLIGNALSNIARHTDPSTPVRVTLRREGVRAVATFDDGGPGMPDVAYGVAPERFQRFDRDRSRATGGSGLGMSIMADVTDAMGGEMSISRSDLGGLRLAFSFPVAAAPPR